MWGSSCTPYAFDKKTPKFRPESEFLKFLRGKSIKKTKKLKEKSNMYPAVGKNTVQKVTSGKKNGKRGTKYGAVV